MTLEQFTEQIRRKNQWKFLIDISIAIVIAVVGLLIFYKLYTSDWFERGKPNSTFTAKLIVYGFSVGLVILGIWAIRKVKRDYQLLTITTGLDKNRNEELINKIADNLNWTLLKAETVIEYLGNTHYLFGYSYDIRILPTDKKLHLDIQSIRAGVIDFGDKTRLVKKIKREIAASLQHELSVSAG